MQRMSQSIAEQTKQREGLESILDTEMIEVKAQRDEGKEEAEKSKRELEQATLDKARLTNKQKELSKTLQRNFPNGKLPDGSMLWFDGGDI